VKRREFITLLGGAAAAWPLAGHAQQTATPVVGFLNLTSRQDQGRADAFRKGLSEAGFIEARNVAVEYRWAGGQNEPLDVMAADLVRRQVNVIAAGSDNAAIAARAATQNIPIVFAGGGDPVKLGLVASLNRPGGNATGVVNLNIELGPKRLQLLHELVPSSQVMVLLVNPTSPNADTVSRDLESAAHSVGVNSRILLASKDGDFEHIFSDIAAIPGSALVIGADVFFTTRSQQLAALADLPVQQATKVQLVINARTAKALNVTVPVPLLGRADEVIE
jgi:putative tryptophan/tyrosine transport system substrate-binding protein